jgi:dethiobiotin synthetase
MHAFITGTDTGVGKTFATALLLRHLRAGGADCVGFKPICCGSRDDAEKLLAASGGDGSGVTLNEVNPVWLRTPAAPLTAAMIEGRMIDLAAVRESFALLRARHRGGVLVEGVGGWLVPITREYSVADLAVELDLPVIVVVKNRLGALNHAALTVRAIQHRGLRCAGLIFNDGATVSGPVTSDAEIDEAEAAESIARTTNPAVCEDLLGVPILAALSADQSAWPAMSRSLDRVSS